MSARPRVTYFFESSKGNKTYQTIRWSDGSLSCDCPGWCKRVVGGTRTCKHVRFVEAGLALRNATEIVEHKIDGTIISSTTKGVEVEAGSNSRAFKFE